MLLLPSSGPPMGARQAPRRTGIWLDLLDPRRFLAQGSLMKKAPGVFSLLASAATGFGGHLVTLCNTAWSRLTASSSGKSRPGKR